MTVVTAARPTEPLAHYGHLHPFQQNVFDTCMEQADNTRDAGDYNHAMQLAATAIGIALPDGGEIAKCACQDCHCDAIFDTAGPGLREVETTLYNLPRLQCAACADTHPAPHED